MTVNVNLPKNISDVDLQLFAHHTSYELEPLSVNYIEDALLSYQGIAFRNNTLLPGCIQTVSEDKKGTVERMVAEHISSVNTHPENIIRGDDKEVYLHIHHPFSYNYWHWMSESILRLWTVKHESKNMILVLPKFCSDLPYVVQSLAPFEFKGVLILPEGKHLRVRNLCVPAIKPLMDSYYKAELAGIRDLYQAHTKTTGHAVIDEGPKIYLSRQRSKTRKIINEDEVIELVRSYGFNVVFNENYSFYEQVSLYSNCNYLVSTHGAGMTNMLFMKGRSSVLEFHKKKTNDEDWHSFAFWYLADALNFGYYHQLCDPVDPQSGFYRADLVVDIDLLEKNCRAMIESSF